jgi:hypothetical protein
LSKILSSLSHPTNREFLLKIGSMQRFPYKPDYVLMASAEDPISVLGDSLANIYSRSVLCYRLSHDY